MQTDEVARLREFRKIKINRLGTVQHLRNPSDAVHGNKPQPWDIGRPSRRDNAMMNDDGVSNQRIERMLTVDEADELVSRLSQRRKHRKAC